MDIIEEYLLGGPIFEEKYKCYTILESSHDGPLSDDAKSSQKWSGKLIPGVARWLKFNSETFFVFHPEKNLIMVLGGQNEMYWANKKSW